MNLFRDAEKVNFDNYERGRQDVYLYHEEHLPYKTTIRKMRPPVYKIIFFITVHYILEKKNCWNFFSIYFFKERNRALLQHDRKCIESKNSQFFAL